MSDRNASPIRAAPHTPLIWAWGGAILMATTWLTGIIALFRGIGSMFH